MAPSNLITLLDAIPPYWEAGRKQMYARMADPTTPEGKALLVAESPLTKAKDIVTPLLVVQGKNDPRVNVRESNQIVAAVRDNGKPVEYLVAADEGHGFARPINNLAMVTAMEGFFEKYLGGRDQKEVPAEVEAKLKEMTVDPKTVSGAVELKGALAPRRSERAAPLGGAPVCGSARSRVVSELPIIRLQWSRPSFEIAWPWESFERIR